MVRGPDRDVTRRDVLDAMETEGAPRRPWTANSLADHLPCSSDTVYNRLRELETLGHIRTKKVGSRARIWWVPETTVAPHVPDTTDFTSRIDADVVDAMSTRDDYAEAWTTSELEDVTGHGQDSIYNRLRELENRELVQSEKVGARARVWWLPGDAATADEFDGEVPA